MQSHDTNRRLTTILMADVVEYSRMMAADEEGTLARLKANRKDMILPKEREYKGRTVKLMGDGVLMEFGSVRDALNFAVDVQRAIIQRNRDLPLSEQIRYRIGINIGDVITEGDDLYGDGINICARLESNCRPDSILLSESAYMQVEKAGIVNFEALGKQKLKNLPEPIAVYQALLEDNHTTSLEVEPTKIKPSQVVAGVSLALLVVAFLVYAILYPGSTPVNNSGPRTALNPPEHAEQTESTAAVSTEGTKTTIAVLPFENLSGDPEQQYFSDGVSEDIITDLSQLPELSVIARASSFSFRGNQSKVQEIGQDLGAEYLLQGSIRKSANRIRINAQLIDAKSGHSLWAERYEGELADVFALQDEIRHKIVIALSIKLSEGDTRPLWHHRTNNFAAYDLLLQARNLANQVTRDGTEQAIGLYRKAIELDPGFARAYGNLSTILIRSVLRGYADDPESVLQQAYEQVTKAVALDPQSPNTLWSLGYAYMNQKNSEQAIKALQKAVAISPSFADGYGLLALINNNMGKPHEAIQHARIGMELNPMYTWDYPYNLGRAYYAIEEYETAVSHLSEALDRNPAVMQPRLYLIGSYVQLDRLEDAEWEVTELEVQHPELTLTLVREASPLSEPNLRQRLFSDLRTAGLEE